MLLSSRIAWKCWVQFLPLCKKEKEKLLGVYNKLFNKMKEGQEEEIKPTPHTNYISNFEQPRAAAHWHGQHAGLRNTVCPWCLLIRIWSLIKSCQEVCFGRTLECRSREFAEGCPLMRQRHSPSAAFRQPLALVRQQDSNCWAAGRKL